MVLFEGEQLVNRPADEEQRGGQLYRAGYAAAVYGLARCLDGHVGLGAAGLEFLLGAQDAVVEDAHRVPAGLRGLFG